MGNSLYLHSVLGEFWGRKTKYEMYEKEGKADRSSINLGSRTRLEYFSFFNVLNKRINYALHGGREQEATKKS